MNYLKWHMGVGDAIAFADLAVKLSDGNDTIVPCWSKNHVSVSTIFSRHPHITVYPVRDHAENDFLSDQYRCIKLGHYSGIPRLEGEDMIQWVYRTAGRDPSERFEDMVVLKAAANVEQIDDSSIGDAVKSQCVFLHEDTDREFLIDRGRVKRERWNGLITPIPSDDISILSWVRSLLMVGSVHVIDSAFLHLTEAVLHQGSLNYHKYARKGSEDYKCLAGKWTVLE